MDMQILPFLLLGLILIGNTTAQYIDSENKT